MLTTYLPLHGKKASVSYTLPTEKQRVRTLGGTDTSYQPARSQGKIYGSGTGAPFFDSGQLACVFQFTPNFALVTRNWQSFGGISDMAAVESALSEFYEYVVLGGLGTLTDVPPSGYRVIKADGTIATCTQRTCTAIVVPGSISVAWQDGGTVAELSVTLECPVGYWSCNTSPITLQPMN